MFFSRIFTETATLLPGPLSSVFNDAAAHFERSDAKRRLFRELQQGLQDGTIDQLEAVKRISYSVHGKMTRRDGKPYMSHIEAVVDAPQRYVDIEYTKEQEKLAWVHDVPEDSKGAWKVRDFRKLGFSEEFLQGLDAHTKRKGELYLDYVERLSQTIALDVKIGDNRHNWANNPKPDREKLYRISSHYLIAVKYGRAETGSSIAEWAAREGMYDETLFAQYSSRQVIRGYKPPLGKAHMASIPAPAAL